MSKRFSLTLTYFNHFNVVHEDILLRHISRCVFRNQRTDIEAAQFFPDRNDAGCCIPWRNVSLLNCDIQCTKMLCPRTTTVRTVHMQLMSLSLLADTAYIRMLTTPSSAQGYSLSTDRLLPSSSCCIAISQWMSSNRLLLNVEKTLHMVGLSVAKLS